MGIPAPPRSWHSGAHFHRHLALQLNASIFLKLSRPLNLFHPLNCSVRPLHNVLLQPRWEALLVRLLPHVQRGSNPPSRPPTPASASPTQQEPRVYGFDANQYRQNDPTQHDCNKVNGLTFPRTIRPSAFTQRLDIEGCDPLALPVAALLYQQADNFWLRKLAHGREIHLIPTGDIAAVVFGTELLSQLRNRGIDLDRVSQCRARQDGQTLDKINNTKYAAKVVAEYIQQWVPMKATDPSSQHTITQLQQQVAELKQRLGDISDTAPPESSTPPPPTSSPSAPPPDTPIGRALQGNPASPPPAFEPASLLVTPPTANAWLTDHPITSLAVRTCNQWLRDLTLTPAQRATVDRNLGKVEDWWNEQPDSAVDTVQRTALMMGLPMSVFKGNFNDTNLAKVLTVAVFPSPSSKQLNRESMAGVTDSPDAASHDDRSQTAQGRGRKKLKDASLRPKAAPKPPETSNHLYSAGMAGQVSETSAAMQPIARTKRKRRDD
eukprot:s4263_g5.t3